MITATEFGSPAEWVMLHSAAALAGFFVLYLAFVTFGIIKNFLTGT